MFVLNPHKEWYNQLTIREAGVRKLHFRLTGCKPVHLKNN